MKIVRPQVESFVTLEDFKTRATPREQSEPLVRGVSQQNGFGHIFRSGQLSLLEDREKPQGKPLFGSRQRARSFRGGKNFLFLNGRFVTNLVV